MAHYPGGDIEYWSDRYSNDPARQKKADDFFMAHGHPMQSETKPLKNDPATSSFISTDSGRKTSVEEITFSPPSFGWTVFVLAIVVGIFRYTPLWRLANQRHAGIWSPLTFLVLSVAFSLIARTYRSRMLGIAATFFFGLIVAICLGAIVFNWHPLAGKFGNPP